MGSTEEETDVGPAAAAPERDSALAGPSAEDVDQQQSATLRLPLGRAGAPEPEIPRPPPSSDPTQPGSAPGPHERLSVSPTADSTAPSGSRQPAGPTPLETLHVEEVHRSRVFVRIACGMAIVVAISSPFMGKDAFARYVVLGGMALILGSCGWLGWHIRDDAGYTPNRVVTVGFMSTAGAISSLYFFGVFSPAAVVFPFGIYFFSLSQSFGATVATYLACALGYLTLAALSVAGVIADVGVVNASGLPVLDRMTIVFLVEATFAATFVVGRATRRASLFAVEQHDRLLRNLALREALLREARQDLQQALAAGGVGRYTEEILGSFRLGAILGRGAMGDVYEAVHMKTGGAAAVKLLQPHLLRDPENVRRFLREAKLAAAIRVPNVVQVLEIGGVDADAPYIAMERLRGEDLADHLRRHRRLSVRRMLKLAREVGRGLMAAREAGIVHRDLKPRNVFLADVAGKRRIWKILDFGVSKLAAADGTLTHDRVIGTPAYMAPEQARGERVTHKSDVYALGVLCYRALTGRPAFAGSDIPETLYNVTHTMPPRPGELAELPEAFDAVLAVGLAKDVADRFDTADELVEALEAAAEDEVDTEVEERAVRALKKHPWGWQA